MDFYKLLSTLFWFIRKFYFPNPFEALGEGIVVAVNEFPLLLTPDILNYLAGAALPTITYIIAGIYYRKGYDNPAWGSILNMFFLCIHTLILYLLLQVLPIKWLMIIIVACYIGFLVLFFKFMRKKWHYT